MMVHEREDSVTCGPVMPQGGIQALEAMLYTLDRLNGELKLLRNVTIGAHILDDCDKDTYGLEMAVDFIKGMVGVMYPVVAVCFVFLVCTTDISEVSHHQRGSPIGPNFKSEVFMAILKISNM